MAGATLQETGNLQKTGTLPQTHPVSLLQDESNTRLGSGDGVGDKQFAQCAIVAVPAFENAGQALRLLM